MTTTLECDEENAAAERLRWEYDISKGLPQGALETLTLEQKLLVMRLLGRAQEQGYRRGFQQGAFLAKEQPNDIHADVHRWRCGLSHDFSPWAERGAKTEYAAERLITENATVGEYVFGYGKSPRIYGDVNLAALLHLPEIPKD